MPYEISFVIFNKFFKTKKFVLFNMYKTTCIVLLLSFVCLLLILMLSKSSGSENFIVQDKSHCPKRCTPFMYPDMYSPRGSCSNPFAWGYTYSTGRCLKLYK
jgi:hypothetical protein